MRSWDLHHVDEAPGHPDEDLYLEQERINFAELPYVAVRRRTRTRPQVDDLSSFQVSRDYPEPRLALLIGIDRACRVRSDVLLMALGVPGRTRNQNDPLVTELLRCVKERDMQVVVAAGNFGPRQDTLSELARVPGVVSVAATDFDGALLTRSSRGVPGGPLPTVASVGDDSVIVVGGPSFEPGTSFASGPVSRMCAMLRAMVWWMDTTITRASSGLGPPALPDRMILTQLDTRTHPSGLPELGSTPDVSEHLAAPEAKQAWLDEVSSALTRVELEYTLSWRPGAVLGLLQRLAEAPPSPDPAGFGAGFIDENVLRRALIRLRPSMFFTLFADQATMTLAHKLYLDDLDGRLGPLWDITDYLVWAQYYTTRLQYVAVTR